MPCNIIYFAIQPFGGLYQVEYGITNFRMWILSSNLQYYYLNEKESLTKDFPYLSFRERRYLKK